METAMKDCNDKQNAQLGDLINMIRGGSLSKLNRQKNTVVCQNDTHNRDVVKRLVAGHEETHSANFVSHGNQPNTIASSTSLMHNSRINTSVSIWSRRYTTYGSSLHYSHTVTFTYHGWRIGRTSRCKQDRNS